MSNVKYVSLAAALSSCRNEFAQAIREGAEMALCRMTSTEIAYAFCGKEDTNSVLVSKAA